MSSQSPPKVHPDFADASADAVLVASDGTHFCVSSVHLVRTAEFFRGMFDLPQDPQNLTLEEIPPLVLEEDARTLEILLKLALGLPARLTRLKTVEDVEGVLLAAEKYGMEGPEEILGTHLCSPLVRGEPLMTYAIASRHGRDDVAKHYLDELVVRSIDFKKLSQIESRHLIPLMTKRQERILNFCAGLRSTHEYSPFLPENSLEKTLACRRHASACGSACPDAQPSWFKFQSAIMAAY